MMDQTNDRRVSKSCYPQPRMKSVPANPCRRAGTAWLLAAVCACLPAALFGAGNIVNQTWHLRTGDDRLWASPDYPVSNWQEYNLGVSAEHQNAGNTFWLRQTFRIPTPWSGEPLRCELRIQAREVDLYLNGVQLPLERNSERIASFLAPAKLLRAVGEDNHLALRISGSDYTGGVSQDFLTIHPEKKAVPSAALNMKFATRDHAFSSGVDVHFDVVGRLDGAATSAGTLRVRIENEFHKLVFVQERPATFADKESSLRCEIPSLPAGFYEVVAAYSASGIEVQDVQWFAVAPTELSCPHTAPADLAEFWQRAKAELAAVPPEFSVQWDEKRSTAAHRVYSATMKSVGGVTLHAWYIVPNKPGRFPVVLDLPGYGGVYQPEWLMGDSDIAHLAIEPRGHGRSTDKVNPGFGTPGFVGYRILDPENYAYRGAYLDCVRAVDFLGSRPEIDPARIAVKGPSQGGGLAIATAALSDGRVKCCVTAVPFLGDFLHHLQIRPVYIPEFTEALKADGHATLADVARTMSYIDTVNLAPWIRCPVLMGSGLFDDDCPPHINFAVYNQLGGPKDYRIYPTRPHNVGPEWEPDARAWLRRQFGLE